MVPHLVLTTRLGDRKQYYPQLTGEAHKAQITPLSLYPQPSPQDSELALITRENTGFLTWEAYLLHSAMVTQPLLSATQRPSDE